MTTDDSPVLGIDLGTTNSVVAVVLDGEVRVLSDASGERLVPSAVAFPPDGRVLVGRAAREYRHVDPAAAIFSIKRLLARPFASEDAKRSRKRLPFVLEEEDGGGIVVRVGSQRYALTEISALVLRHVRDVAEAALDRICERAVVTVPANFTQAQREATKIAAKVAGLDVLRVVNEPTAAALAYGYSGGSRERVAVYDFGGGTFDLTVLELAGDVFEVMATAGDMFLGGDDVDLVMAERLADRWKERYREDPRDDARAYERIRIAAEAAKCQLSSAPTTGVLLESLDGKRVLELQVTRDELDDWIRPIVARARQVCSAAMGRANVRIEQIDNVILVGGTTRIPLIRREVAEFFARAPITALDPDLIVAHGAAVYAESLAARGRPLRSGGSDMRVPAQAGPSFEDVAEAQTLAARSPYAQRVAAEDAPTVARRPDFGEAPTAGKEASDRFVEHEAITTPGVGSPFARPPSGQRMPAALDQEPTRVASLDQQPTRVASLDQEPTRVASIVPGSGLMLDADTAEGSGAPLTLDLGGGADLDLPPEPARPGSSPAAPAFTPPPGSTPAPSALRGLPPLEQFESPTPIGRSSRPRTPSNPALPTLRGSDLPAKLASKPPVRPAAARAVAALDAARTSQAPAAGTPSRPSPPRSVVGASSAASIPLPNRPPPLLLDVTANALGVETTGGYCEPVIPPNMAVPVEQTREFTTATDDQDVVRVRVCQGDSPRFEENELLGEFELTEIPPMPRGDVKIEVTFFVDPDGTLAVKARDTKTGREQAIQIHLLGGVDEGRAAQMRERQDRMLGKR